MGLIYIIKINYNYIILKLIYIIMKRKNKTEGNEKKAMIDGHMVSLTGKDMCNIAISLAIIVHLVL